MTTADQPFSRLAFFPIMMFAIIMGLSGLTLAYQKANHIFGIHIGFAYAVQTLVTVSFFIILCIYIAKIFFHRDMVKDEIKHPVRINFLATVPVSFLLLSVVYAQFYYISFTLFLIGLVLQTILTFYTIAFWINRNIEINHSNPAWFIPVVGNIIIPLAGTLYLPRDFLMFYFSFGIFFWIILTAILFNRIIFHNQMPQKFLPTLSIFIAPPSVAMLAYIKMYQSYDIFAVILLNLGIFFGILILVLIKNFYKIKFFISWWAFTFPIAALTLAVLTAYENTNYIFYKYFGLALLIIITFIVALVGYKTIIAIIQKDICKDES